MTTQDVLDILRGGTKRKDFGKRLQRAGFDLIGTGCESIVFGKDGLDYVVKVMDKAHRKKNPSEKFTPYELRHPFVTKTEAHYLDPCLIIFQERVKPVDASCFYGNRDWRAFEALMRDDGFSDIFEANVGVTEEGKFVAIDWTYHGQGNCSY